MSTRRGQLEGDLKRRLIRVLCDTPLLKSYDGRTTCLLSLPASVQNQITQRAEHNCRTDLTFIVDALQYLQLQDGRWPLLMLIDCVLDELEGTTLAQDLAAIDLEILQILEPPTGLDVPPPPQEEVIVGIDERVPIGFLAEGFQAGRAVARILVHPTIGGYRYRFFGTGWMIAPSLLLTNHHVIKARENNNNVTVTLQEFEQQALGSAIWFGFDVESYSEYGCRELVHSDSTLDYALLRLNEKSNDGVRLDDWGYLKIVRTQPQLFRGQRLNIIQHPGGRSKQVALRSNFYIGSVASKSRFHYLSDTEGGSSGSPVFNDQWQVVGLHRGYDWSGHYYKGFPIQYSNLGLQHAVTGKYAGQTVSFVNEGMLIHSILSDLPPAVRQEIDRAQGWD